MTGPASSAFADQATAAVEHTARDLANLVAPLGGNALLEVECPDWVTAFIHRVNAAATTRTCRHLLRPGPQPINVLAWAPDVRLCSACALDNSIRASCLPGLTAADRARADQTCDACAQHQPGGIDLSAFQPIGAPFLIWVGLCGPCGHDLANHPLGADHG